MLLTQQEFDESFERVQELGCEIERLILLFKDFCEKNHDESEKILSLLRLAEVLLGKSRELNDNISDMEVIRFKLS